MGGKAWYLRCGVAAFFAVFVSRGGYFGRRRLKKAGVIGAVGLISLLLVLFFPLPVFADEDSASFDTTFSSFGGDAVWEALPEEVRTLLSDEDDVFSPEKWLENLSVEDLFALLWVLFSESLRQPLKLLLPVLGMTLFSALFCRLAEDKNGGRSIFSFFSEIFLLLALLMPVSRCITNLSATLSSVKSLLHICLPVLLALLTASGQSMTAAAGSAFLYTALSFGVTLFSSCLLPYFRADLVLSAAGGGGDFGLSSLLVRVRKTVTALFSFLVSLLLGFWGLQKNVASSADSLALRTGKFALSSLVPVVGGPLSEAMNGMTNALALVKSCVGSLSLVGLFFLFAPTLLELAVWSALLSAGEFSADFLGVAGQKALFSTLAGLLKFCLATLSATAAFFLLGVGMLFLQSA